MGRATLTIAWLLGLAGCDTASIGECAGTGRPVSVLGVDYCVFPTRDGDGVACPRGLSNRLQLDGGVVCSAVRVEARDLPGSVCMELLDGSCGTTPDAATPDDAAPPRDAEPVRDAEPMRDATPRPEDAASLLDAGPALRDASSLHDLSSPEDASPGADGAAPDATVAMCGADEPNDCDTCVLLTSVGDTEITRSGSFDGPDDSDCWRFHMDDGEGTTDELLVAVLTTPRVGVSLTLYQAIVPCRTGTSAALNLSECTAPIGALASCGDRPDYGGSDETGDYFLFVSAAGASACLPYEIYVRAGL